MHSPLIRRRRQRSIRTLLSAIFIVPLASLIGLWGFAASVTVTNAIREHNFKTENTLYGGSAQGLGAQLGQERLLAYEYLSSGRRLPEQTVVQQFAKTDATLGAFFRGVKTGPGMLQPVSWSALRFWEHELGRPLSDLRAKVESGHIAPLAAFDAYNKIITAQFGVYTQLIAVDNITLYQQAAASIAAGRGLELAERELTLVTGAFAAGGQMSKDARLEFASAVYNKQLLMSDALTRLQPSLGSGYRDVLTSAPYRAFAAIEDSIIGSIGSKRPVPVSPQKFAAASAQLFRNYQAAEAQDRLALTREGTQVGNQLLLEVSLAGGAGLLAVILSIFLMVRFGRRISRELRGLQRAALDLAQDRLPRVVQRLSAGEDVDVASEAAPLAPGRILETVRVAEAFSSVQRTAVEAAVGQARIRRGVSQVFRNLAWRSQSLLHRQLALLDTMERRQTEPETLDELFQLDHLTTRMRRHAEGLIILSGSSPGRGWRDPVPVMDVIRAAIAEVEDYKRVSVICDSQDAVVGSAVADVIHLLAELIENATTYSPASTEVTIRAEPVANGFAAEIEDRGIGLSPDDIATVNERLANPPEFDLADSNQLGLFVVARLAGKHRIVVTLRRSPYGGTTAIVLLPSAIVASAGLEAFDAFRDELPAAGSPALAAPFPGLSIVGSAGTGPGEPGSGEAGPVTQAAAHPAGGDLAGGLREGVIPGSVASATAPAENAGVMPAGAASAITGPAMAGPALAGPALAGPALAGAPPTVVTPAGADPAALPQRAFAATGADATIQGAGSGSPWFQGRPGAADAQASGAQASGAPGSAALPVRRLTPHAQPEPWRSAGDAGSSSAPSAGEAAKPWLPRRQRQASLAPQLRDRTPAQVDDDGSDGPSPAGTRALVESLQYGLDRARATPATPEDSWPAAESGPGDPWPATDAWPAGNWPPPAGPDGAAAAEDSEGH